MGATRETGSRQTGSRQTLPCFALSAVLLAATGSGEVSAAPRADQDWLRCDAGGLKIVSNAGSARTRGLTRHLGRLRSVLAAHVLGRRTLRVRPTSVYLLANPTSARAYTRAAERPGGQFFAHRRGNFVVVDLEAEYDPTGLLYHELVHAVLSDNAPDLPLWINEGLAELFSTLWLSDYQAELGAPVEEYRALLRRGDAVAVANLFAVDADSVTYAGGEAKSLFHARSWALAHYLVVGNRALAARWPIYFRRLETGSQASAEALFFEVFRTSAGALERQLEVDLQRADLPRFTTGFAAPPAPSPALAALAPEEVWFELGWLLAHQDERGWPEAEQHFRRALELEPGHAWSRQGLEMVRAWRSGED